MQNIDNALLQQILDNTQDIIIITKADNIESPGPEIIYVNDAFTELTGYSKQEAIGENPRILQGIDTDELTKRQIKKALVSNQPVRVTIKNYSKSGHSYWLDLSIQPLYDEAGNVTHFAAIERDVSKQKNRELQFEAEAKTDVLTGLNNRRSFNEAIFQEIARFKRNANVFSLVVFDLDHFKSINDTYGHPMGDYVLKKIGLVCQSFARVNDIAARIGGEEFCLLLSDTNEEKALTMAERLREEISALHFTSLKTKEVVPVSASFGVTEVISDDESASTIMLRADAALYQSKKAGRNNCHIYLHL